MAQVVNLVIGKYPKNFQWNMVDMTKTNFKTQKLTKKSRANVVSAAKTSKRMI